MPKSVFEEAVSRLMDAIDQPSAQESLDGDLQLIRGILAMRLRRSFVAAADVEDAVDETLFLFVRACKKGKIARHRSPAGYLNAITRHQMIARWRERERLAAHPSSGPEDPLEIVLNATAAASSLDAAYAAAREANDIIAIRVASAWLDLAERLAGYPTSREVGRECDLSHTTVLAALGRLRSYFPADVLDAY